jgi:HSP20 family protein
MKQLRKGHKMKNEMTRKDEVSPFRMFGEIERDMDRMVDIFWRNSEPNSINNSSSPSYEVSEKNGHYLLNIGLPGIPKNKIKVDFVEGKLHVHGENKSDYKEGNYAESRSGKFERTMTLPTNVSTDDAQAIFEDGVLTIALKKTGDPKIKRIKIGTKKSSGLWPRLIGAEKNKMAKKTRNKKVA